MPALPCPVYSAILLADRHSAAGIEQRIERGRRLAGAGFATIVGDLDGDLVAVAHPLEGPPDFPRIIAALRDAYRPEVVLGAGMSWSVGSRAEVGAKVLATRVVGPDGGALRLKRLSPLEDLCEGELVEAANSVAASTPIGEEVAANDWCYTFASACAAASQAAAVVTVVERDPDAPVGDEVRHVLRQRTTAARAGALLRAAWKRPMSLVDLTRRKARGWERQESLADAIEAVLRGGR